MGLTAFNRARREAKARVAKKEEVSPVSEMKQEPVVKPTEEKKPEEPVVEPEVKTQAAPKKASKK